MIPLDGACADLRVSACPRPSRACARFDVLMARLRPGGIFELLSPQAWARVLGYPAEELSAKIVAELLDPHADAPLEVPLRCKDGQRKYFRFHRRSDERAHAIFLVADELQ